jgi:hypothetical protein
LGLNKEARTLGFAPQFSVEDTLAVLDSRTYTVEKRLMLFRRTWPLTFGAVNLRGFRFGAFGNASMRTAGAVRVAFDAGARALSTRAAERVFRKIGKNVHVMHRS